MIIKEGLRQNDLKYLVSNYISVDQYTSKLDDDNITVAFFCNEKEVAEDLKDFIEKIYYIEIKDIEISDSLTDDNKFILFVEFERNINFPKMIMDIIDSINKVTGNDNWKFKTFDMNDKADLSLDNLNEYVRLSKLRNGGEIIDKSDEKKEEKSKDKKDKKVEESFKPIVINDRGWKRTYFVKGYVSQNEMEKMIAESNTINSRDNSELYLLENMYPNCQIISTDTNVFVVNGSKILMLG